MKTQNPQPPVTLSRASSLEPKSVLLLKPMSSPSQDRIQLNQHFTLLGDPNVATLLIKKSDSELSLIITLQSVKDERPQHPSKSYSMVIANSNPAFSPHFASLSSEPPAATCRHLPRIS